MKGPGECDWEYLVMLGRYVLDKPSFARVVALNAESKASGVLTVYGFTDSILVNVGSSVIIAHPQTQPGLRTTSSGEAENRALSRGARDINVC